MFFKKKVLFYIEKWSNPFSWSAKHVMDYLSLHLQKTTTLHQIKRGWEVPSTGGRSSTVSFKFLPLLNTRTVCHSLSFRFWPAKIVSGPLPAGQSKQRLTHTLNTDTHTHIHNREVDKSRIRKREIKRKKMWMDEVVGQRKKTLR